MLHPKMQLKRPMLHPNIQLNPLSPNVADLQHFDIELFVASLFVTLSAQALTLLQLVYYRSVPLRVPEAIVEEGTRRGEYKVRQHK